MPSTNAPAPAPGQVHRTLDSLTGLRMIAALAVFVTHIRFVVPNAVLGAVGGHHLVLDRVLSRGQLGVNFFFILSGFVLAYSHHGAPADAATFYRRRIARIWPSHAVTWAIVLLLSIVVVGYRTSILSAALNLVLLQAWTGTRAFKVNDVAWTLSCEAFFYAVFPFVWSVLRRQRTTGLLAIGGACALIPFVIVLLTSDDRLISNFPPSRLADFVVGMVAARLVQEGRISWIPPMWLSVTAFGVVAALSAVVKWKGLWVAAPLLPLTLIIMAAASADLSGRRSWLTSEAAQLGGRWSFAFYLVHNISIHVVTDRYGFRPFGWPLTVATAVGTFAIAVVGAGLLYTRVERPAERWLRRRWIT